MVAMANYHLDNRAEAVRLLREYNQWMDEQQAEAPDRIVPVAFWSDWVCRLILRREAEQLIQATELEKKNDKQPMSTAN